MKLLYCPKCRDIISLAFARVKRCRCGNARGAYLGVLAAAHNGAGSIIILNTWDFQEALRRSERPDARENCNGMSFQIRCATGKPFDFNTKVLPNESLEAAAKEAKVRLPEIQRQRRELEERRKKLDEGTPKHRDYESQSQWQETPSP